MQAALARSPNGTPQTEILANRDSSVALTKKIMHWLDEAKAEKLVEIDLAGKSSIGDFMVIASGNTDRHVGAIADLIHRNLKSAGEAQVRIEGTEQCDWVLIDTGDIIIHVFRPEVRDFYNLEKMWLTDIPADLSQH